MTSASCGWHFKAPIRGLLSALLAIAALCPLDAQAADGERIIVIAHRGAHQNAPENTIASIEDAITLGCDYVELDVRRTSDGAMVLMHDGSLDRTTNGTGRVENLTLAQVRELTVDTVPGETHRVPTFDEALSACRGRMKVYVDHKAAPPAEIIAALKAHQMIDEAIIYSSIEQLREFKKLEPTLRIMPPHPGKVADIAALAKDLRPETLDGGLDSWTAEQVKAAHDNHAEVWVDALGETDNLEGYERALEIGVDAIQTDRPAELIEFLRGKNRR